MAEQQAIETPDFDSAFAELAALAEGKQPEDNPPPQDTTEAPAETAAETPEDEPADDAADDETEGDDEPGDEPEDDPEPEAKLSDEEILARFAALVKKAEPEKQEQPKAAPKAQETPIYTQEEEQFLQSYEKDWPDVAKAEALRRRSEYRQLVGYVFQEIAKEFKPILETVEVLSQRTHLSDLQSTVSDYEDVRDKVVEWVGKQPAYLQQAYNHVITHGTVEEVADLIDRYKKDTGASAKPAAAATTKKETELPPATKQAAAALAPVSSKRSAVVQAADPNDFEAAFASFADKL